MTIKLTDIKNIANIVKSSYGKYLDSMSFIFCYKIDENKYFIFQEIQNMPIERLVYQEPNNSVVFVAAWSAWGNPNSFVADANNELVENFKDLLDRSRVYNRQLDASGGYHNNWNIVDRRNKKEKYKTHKEKYDTFVEFRIEKIERANFYKWGFELFSQSLNLIAINNKSLFPYDVDDAEQDPGFPARLSWQGKTFNIESPNSYLSVPSSVPTSSLVNSTQLLSYWNKDDYDEANDIFDEEIAEILLNDGETDETIYDVGQKDVDLLLD